MRFSIYTVGKSDIEPFEGSLPDEIIENCGKRGFFTIGAADPSNSLIGVTQFYIGILPDGECVSDVYYIYVDEDIRGNGAGSRMLNKVHSILKKSGVSKSIAFMSRKQSEKEMFKESGYLFMKIEEKTTELFEELYPGQRSRGMEQGIFWVDR